MKSRHTKKLSLRKETLRTLDAAELQAAAGGGIRRPSGGAYTVSGGCSTENFVGEELIIIQYQHVNYG